MNIQFISRITGLLIAVLMMFGCTTQSSLIKEANWYQLGFNAGNRGESATTAQALEVRAKDISTEKPDHIRYLEGYQQGIHQYCSLERLQQLGQEGKTDWQACEFRREDAGLYLIYWQRGYERWLSFTGPHGA
ncbi:DUF2799 domain-containing protein [Photobacterium makurazakiensis]|uniref:DUF2799 domain-containing protein n=1 Tax=Photobacterium makurazakiensis TaxID=2910234 RepID=UPI003D0CB01D